MKSPILILFLFSFSVMFAQQTSNSIFNYSKSTNPRIISNSLNMNAFKLEDFVNNTTSISESLRKSYNQRPNPSDNMPIFEAKGKFFLKIFEVYEDIDHKLRIFQFEESKYFFRSMG